MVKETHMAARDSQTRKGTEKPVWHTPRLEELGDIRELVQVGLAKGKSGAAHDGSSAGGPETMN